MKQEFFIIGAGVAGLSTAVELSRTGARVQLADGGHTGQSSWAGAGIIFPLLPWDYSEEMNRLALAGMQLWPEWANELRQASGLDPEFWACGMEIRDAGSVQLIQDWCASHHVAALPSPGNTIWLPEVAQVRNPRLIASLRNSVASSGGEIIGNCPITGLETQGRRVLSAKNAGNTFRAEQFILCTGAWSSQIALPNPVPNIRPMRGQMLLYAPGSHNLKHIIYRDGMYLVPRKDGHLLAGSTLENAGFDASTTTEALADLHAAACDLLPELRIHQPIKSWAGLRPGSPDNIPLIDRHPDFDNLWINTGHFRYGVTMAPSSSKLLTEMILGKQTFINPAPYSWQTATGRSWTC